MIYMEIGSHLQLFQTVDGYAIVTVVGLNLSN